jgi:hypothetical protein
VKDSSEQIIIIEVQNTRELDYLLKILYSTSKVICEHMYEGMPYSEVKKIITVSIVYFSLGQGKDYIYLGDTTFKGLHLKDTLKLSAKQKEMFKRQEIRDIYPNHYIIKVNEFDNIAHDTLDEWVYFLKNSEIKDEFKARGLDQARKKLKEIYLDKEELRAYKRYLERLHYEASIAQTITFEAEYDKRKAREEGLTEGRKEGIKEGIKEGKKEGIKEGKEEGKKEKASEIAKLLKNAGDSPEKIAAITGLSIPYIEKL